MTKQELLDQVAMLLTQYEIANGNTSDVVVGAFLDLGDIDLNEWYEYDGETFLRFRGEIDKVFPPGN